MTVKIVTDSTADLPPELITGLGITVVPLYVCFGKDAGNIEDLAIIHSTTPDESDSLANRISSIVPQSRSE